MPWRAVAIGAALIVADQATKLAADRSTTCGVIVCPLRNQELILGLGVGDTLHVAAISVAGLALFAVWVRAIGRRGARPTIAAALVVAGIVANAIDRIALRAVRDFIAVPGNAVINIADLAIVGGLLTCAAAARRQFAQRPIKEVKT